MNAARVAIRPHNGYTRPMMRPGNENKARKKKKSSALERFVAETPLPPPLLTHPGHSGPGGHLRNSFGGTCLGRIYV